MAALTAQPLAVMADAYTLLLAGCHYAMQCPSQRWEQGDLGRDEGRGTWLPGSL